MGSQGREDSHCLAETGGVWDKQGRQSDHQQTLWPHIRAQINRTNCREQSRLRNPGLQHREIKPQTSD